MPWRKDNQDDGFKGDFDKEGITMRKILPNLIVPGLVLMCMLTVSCKEQTSITDPGSQVTCSEGNPIINEHTDLERPHDPDPGGETSSRTTETEEYDILCAPEYTPESGTMNWGSRDNSTQIRIDADQGGTYSLEVQSVPNPGMSVFYQIRIDVPPEALPKDTTLRMVVPEPGLAAFGVLVVEEQSSTEPYALTGTVYLNFKIEGLDLTDVSVDDLVLLRWSDQYSRWVVTSGDVELRDQHIVGNLELIALGKFAVGTYVY
jgi:hypothetical protein